MNDKEYTYDIDKYTIGVDENGEDGIGLTVAKVENGEINFLGNCYGENARCLDLLIKENQELKKKYENTVEKLSEQLKLLTSKLDEYDLIVDERNQLKKQLENSIKVNIADHKYASECEDKVVTLEAIKKEFIKYLEDNYKETQDIWYIKILQKYKEIIGENNGN